MFLSITQPPLPVTGNALMQDKHQAREGNGLVSGSTGGIVSNHKWDSWQGKGG
jgi:hypothetical protein